jgi:hypothetical protein
MYYINVILDYLVNYSMFTSDPLAFGTSNYTHMISPIFTFAPIPLTEELSPLAHAAILIRRRQADNVVVAKPRHRIQPPADKPATETVLA